MEDITVRAGPTAADGEDTGDGQEDQYGQVQATLTLDKQSEQL